MTQQTPAIERLWRHVQETTQRLETGIAQNDTAIDSIDRQLADVRARMDVLTTAMQSHQEGQRQMRDQLAVHDKELAALSRGYAEMKYTLTGPGNTVDTLKRIEETVRILHDDYKQHKQQRDRTTRNLEHLLQVVIGAFVLWVGTQLPTFIRWIGAILP